MIAHRMSILRRAALAAIPALFAARAVPVRAATTIADVSVLKTRTSSSLVAPGGVIDYDVTVTNNGPDSATNIVLTDVVPPQTTFLSFDTGASGVVCTTPPVGGTGTITCPFAPIHTTVASGISFPFQMQLRVDSGARGTIANTATVASDTPDSNPDNNSSTASVSVVPSVPVSPATLWILGAVLAAGGTLLLKR